MSSNIVNQVSYLRTTRDFPEDPQALRIELLKGYIDTANAVNSRTIGLFPVNRPAVSGEEWFLNGPNQRQQGQRQVYSFTTFSNIAHGLTITNLSRFVRIFGAFTDGSVWYPLPFVDPTAANQVGVKITSTNIVFTAGGGAPAVTSGIVVLEWLNNV